MKLADAKQQTPAVSGVGAWAEQLRQAAFDAVRPEDVTAIMATFVQKAKAGDPAAAKLVLNYLTGGGAPKIMVEKVVVRRGKRRPRVVDEAPLPKPVVVESPGAGLLRKLAAMYLLQHDRASLAELGRAMECGTDAAEAVLDHGWFKRTNQTYQLTSEGRRAVG